MENQKGFTLKSTVIMIAVILVLVAGAFYLQKQKAEQPLSPKEVAEDFYSDYIKNVAPLSEKKYHNSGYLTENIIIKTDELLDSFDYGGYDPFVCAQDVPENFEVRVVDSSEETATVIIKTDFENHEFSVNLVFKGNKWLIDDIDCKKVSFLPDSEEVVDSDNPLKENDEQEEDSEVSGPDPFRGIDPQVRVLIERAINDLSQRLIINPTDIIIGDVVSVVFSDYSLGTSQPGEVYPQTSVSGYVIILSAKGINYKYHASESQTILVNQ